MTILFGLLDFRMKNVLLFTALGIIPEAYVLSDIGDPDLSILRSTIISILALTALLLYLC